MVKTMAEIAKMAGVSIGTVSRVVNNKNKVHPETRARIQTLVDLLNYQPSATARGLALRRTENIMLQVPNIADPYFSDLTKSISRLKPARSEVISVICGVMTNWVSSLS